MSTARPFRFSVQIQGASSGDAWREKMRKAEALGYDVVHMADHFGSQFGIMPALAVAAEVTTTLRLGQLVLQNDLRHPALLAKDIATLDVLSNGRMELGIGAGGSFPPDFEWTGIPLDPAPTRVDRLEESLIVLKGLFADAPFTHEGTHFSLNEYDAHPKPVQKPHPPILVGAGGPRMLKLATRHADIISLMPSMKPGGDFETSEMTVSGMRAKIATVRECAGSRFGDIEFNNHTQVFEVTDRRSDFIASLKDDWQPGADVWEESPLILVGSIDSIADQMRKYREELGLTYFNVRETMLDDFAQVLARLK